MNDSWLLPADVHPDRPATDRMHDYLLGGGYNFRPDRKAADRLLTAAPSYGGYVRDNAEFVRRAVAHMLTSGITQFLDLGSGLATVSCVHGLAHRTAPKARVAYVDTDPITVSHLELAATDDDRISVSRIDLFATRDVLEHDPIWQLLDRTQPIGVLMTAVLHYEPSDDRVADAIHAYYDHMAAGSMLAVTHLTGDYEPTGQIAALQSAHAGLGIPITPRGCQQLSRLLQPWNLRPDGIVPPQLWRPDRPTGLRGAPSYLANAALATKHRWSTS